MVGVLLANEKSNWKRTYNHTIKIQPLLIPEVTRTLSCNWGDPQKYNFFIKIGLTKIVSLYYQLCIYVLTSTVWAYLFDKITTKKLNQINHHCITFLKLYFEMLLSVHFKSVHIIVNLFILFHLNKFLILVLDGFLILG